MRRGLLWLAVVDLSRAWRRPTLGCVAIAAAIVAVAFFSRQVRLREAEVLAAYEEAGAATFVADVSGVSDADVQDLAGGIRQLRGVRSVEAPYSGIALGIVADTSFLVFRNDRQQEYLGARTTVLGVDGSFDSARDYYVNFRDVTASAPAAVINIPLPVTAGAAGPPGPRDVLVASAIADYVGVRPGATATVELIYAGVEPPIVQRVEGLRLTGTFNVAGPDEGRFEPFWRLLAQGQEVLTVRRPTVGAVPVTTLPILLNASVVREFINVVQRDLNARKVVPPRLLQRNELVIRAESINQVPLVEAAVATLLPQHGLLPACDVQRPGSFCLRLPERNNFRAALHEQSKVGSGGTFFVVLLLMLVAAGTAGLQIQTVLTRWHDYGVLQALGFSPASILGYFGVQLLLVLAGGVALAALASLLLPSTVAASPVSFAWAAGVSLVATGVAAVPVLVWPLSRPPAELLREAM